MAWNGGIPDLLPGRACEEKPEEDKGVNDEVTPYEQMNGSVNQASFGSDEDAHVLQQQA